VVRRPPLDTIQARNLIRSIAAGCFAILTPARRIWLSPEAGRQRETEGYKLQDVPKLYAWRTLWQLKFTEKASRATVAKRPGGPFTIAQFGQQRARPAGAGGAAAPKPRQELWQTLGVTPRGIDRAR